MPWRSDLISREPVISSSSGRAWQIAPFAPNMVAQWLIEAPWANPERHSYVFALLALGLHHPPRSKLAQETHQVVLYALDPRYPREVISAQGKLYALTATLLSEFIEREAGEALERALLAVRAICEGLLNPDETSQGWRALFGDNHIKRSA